MYITYKLKYFNLALGSIIALAFALYFQHYRGLVPCELCILQRKVYVVIIILSILAIRIRLFRKLVTLAVAAEVAIAVYHTGIEQHWWQGFTACSSSLGSAQTLEQIRQQLMNSPLVRCDEPQWRYLSLSMAAWNAIYSFGLFIISLQTCRKSI